MRSPERTTPKLPVELRGERVVIRKPKLADAPVLQSAVSRPEVVRWTTRIPHPYPENGALQYLRKCFRTWAKGREYVFAIVPEESGQAAGLVSLGAVSLRHGCAELGYWLGVDWWGRGIATEAVDLALRFAFADLQLYRVYASAYEANRASCRVLEKNGFQLEGTLREAVVREGNRQNFQTFGILRPEYFASRGSVAQLIGS